MQPGNNWVPPTHAQVCLCNLRPDQFTTINVIQRKQCQQVFCKMTISFVIRI